VTDILTPARVRLRDLTLADADLYDELHAREKRDGGYNDLGVEPEPVNRELLAAGPMRNEKGGVMLVERIEDGSVIGTVGWHLVRYGPSPWSDAYMFGIDLVPEARGLGYGTEAQRALAAYLFETTSVNRVEASTDVENVAEQRSLEKAGFTREGVNRGAQFRAGAFHDLVLYAKLRGDPP
jgi:RimJ/RimL family protein N-acetyltransferase